MKKLMLLLVLSVGCNVMLVEAGLPEADGGYSSVGMNALRLSDDGLCYGGGVSMWLGSNELNNAMFTTAPAGSVALGEFGDDTTELSAFVGKKLGVGYLLGRVSTYLQERGDVFEHTNPVTGDVTNYAPNTSDTRFVGFGVEYALRFSKEACSIGWHNQRGLILNVGFSY